MPRWAAAPGRASDTTALVGSGLVVVLFEIISLGQIGGQDDVSLASKIAGAALSLVVCAAFMGLQRLLIRTRASSWTPWLLSSQALGSLSIMFLASSWPLGSLALASTLLALESPRNLLAAGGLVTAHVVTSVVADPGIELAVLVLMTVTNCVTGFALYAMTSLVIVLDELRLTREHLARVRVDEERLRISRDLHDILGRTLVAASLRNEVALRLLDDNPQRCRDQLLELQSTIIEGQSKLRGLTSGPTLVGLADELASAQELCERLGIRALVDAVEVADPEVDQALAGVVREAVTNALKHGRPTTCSIGVRQESLAIVLTVVNDGAAPRVADAAAHTGLEAVSARVASLGGVLTAGPVEPGQFRVIARVPHERPAPAPSAAVETDGDDMTELVR